MQVFILVDFEFFNWSWTGFSSTDIIDKLKKFFIIRFNDMIMKIDILEG